VWVIIVEGGVAGDIFRRSIKGGGGFLGRALMG
jgi:hypothetical protein